MTMDFEEWMEELRVDAGARGLATALTNVDESVLYRLFQSGAQPTVTSVTNLYLKSRAIRG